MKRYQEEKPRIEREWKKFYKQRLEGHSKEWLDAHPEHVKQWKQKGRFRKRDAWDCGNTQCYLCHYDKFPKRETTHQERQADLKFKEGRAELD